jgi:hypothetical protein
MSAPTAPSLIYSFSQRPLSASCPNSSHPISPLRISFLQNQSAYRPFHSTKTVVLAVHNDLVRSINNGQVSAFFSYRLFDRLTFVLRLCFSSCNGHTNSFYHIIYSTSDGYTLPTSWAGYIRLLSERYDRSYRIL